MGLGEEIFVDPIVLCQPLHMKRTAVLLPGLLHSIQRNLNCGKKRERENKDVTISSEKNYSFISFV